MATFTSFEELECWKSAKELRIDIMNLAKTFPEIEKYRLTDQMIRASRSVTANIAEGFGRFHFQENIQFCRSARGSLIELIDHFLVAFENDYIDSIQLTSFRNKIEASTKVLNGYIGYLKKAKASSSNNQ